MRVLWIKSDFPLPADTGGKIRTKHLLVELARRADVTFLCYAPPDHPRRYIDELAATGVRVEAIPRAEEIKSGPGFYFRVLRNLTSQRPYIVKKYMSPEMTALVRELGTPDRHDVVLCDFLEMAWCAEHVSGLPTALFEHNVETLIWRRYHQVESNLLKRLYFDYEQGRVARTERAACAEFDAVLTVSRDDGELLKQDFGLKTYTMLPTGVDVEYFQPQAGEIAGRLVFCGSMDWMPNIDGFWWFYRSIYPRIRKALPTVSFAVVGRRPGPEIVATNQTDQSVLITGTVEDVRPHVAAAQLYLVPLRVGGGTRIKIYEAMAMKKCVVSTSIGAEGLPLVAGEHLVIADGEEAFASAVKELLHDANKRSRIAEAGYRLVTEHYSWSRAASVLYDALKALVASKTSS